MITTDETRIVDNIRYWMSRRDFTQRGLAINARMAESTLSKIFSRRRHLKATELAALAKALDVDVDVLLSE